ncbi:plasmid transfer protein, partial [Streptomyces sp. NPDC046984]
LAAGLIPAERPGTAVAADSSGGWAKIRTPHTSRAEAMAVCREFAHLVPDFPAFDPFRPHVPADAPASGSLVKPWPVTD